MQAGASEDKVRQVERAAESPLFTDRERVALRYAEAMTITGEKVTEGLFGRIRGHFSQTEIVELTAAVASRTSAASSTSPWGSRPRASVSWESTPPSGCPASSDATPAGRALHFPPPAPRMPPSTAHSP